MAAQVLLQKTVWREAAVGAHLRARNELLAALSPDLAAVPKPVFCWETVLKVRLHCWLLQGKILQLCRYSRYQRGMPCRGEALARQPLFRTTCSGKRHWIRFTFTGSVAPKGAERSSIR